MAEKIATREAYGNTIAEIGEKYSDMVVLDADLSKSTFTCKFAEKFPDRFFNMGIAEANLTSVAAGLASCGKIPFVSTFAIFATGRAYDQVRNSIAYPNLNVKIAATHAGISVGEDGASHQSIEDIALMRAIPGMTVICPADGIETALAVKAVVEYKGPVYLRLGRLALPTVYDNPEACKFEIGKSITLQEGTDATIIATGLMVQEAIEAHKILQNEGINVRIINMHTIKPIDEKAIIDAAYQTGRIVTAEEHSIVGGLGEAVASITARSCPVPIAMVGVKDVFGRSGKPAELLKHYGLTASDIVTAVKSLFKKE
ncbi:MAG: transketolase family protein [Deltaproteobacteria bacterium]